MAPKPDPPAAFFQGVPHWYCEGPGHDEPRLLPKSEFFIYHRVTVAGEPYEYRMRVCKHCKYIREPRTGSKGYRQNGLVSLERVEPYLHELEARCGSATKAAKRVGVSHPVYLRWQRRAKWHGDYFTHMYRETAIKVMNTLREVRAEQRIIDLNYVPLYIRAPQKVRRCSGCGGPQSGLTIGCKECDSRHRKRRARAQEASAA